MIAYVDTSVLLKLVVEEPGSAAAETIWDQAEALVAARIGYVEARAALAAARRARRLTGAQHRDAIAAVDHLWSQLSIVEVTRELVLLAAGIAEERRLRGYDAVHLAAATFTGADLMASADSGLCRAAQEAGFHVANPGRA